MKKNRFRKNRIEKFFLNNKLFSFFLIIAFIAILVQLTPTFLKKKELQKELDMLDREIAEKKESTALLKEQIYLLEHDPEYIEKLARKNLGLVREDEVVYKILDSQSPHRTSKE